MAEPTPTPPKPARLIRIVLVVPLSLNLAVAGILIGAASSGRWKGGPPPNFEVALGPITRALAPEERRDIRRSLIQDRALRDLNLRSGMAEVLAALQADPLTYIRSGRGAGHLSGEGDDEHSAVSGALGCGFRGAGQDTLCNAPERKGDCDPMHRDRDHLRSCSSGCGDVFVSFCARQTPPCARRSDSGGWSWCIAVGSRNHHPCCL